MKFTFIGGSKHGEGIEVNPQFCRVEFVKPISLSGFFNRCGLSPVEPTIETYVRMKYQHAIGRQHDLPVTVVYRDYFVDSSKSLDEMQSQVEITVYGPGY